LKSVLNHQPVLCSCCTADLHATMSGSISCNSAIDLATVGTSTSPGSVTVPPMGGAGECRSSDSSSVAVAVLVLLPLFRTTRYFVTTGCTRLQALVNLLSVRRRACGPPTFLSVSPRARASQQSTQLHGDGRSISGILKFLSLTLKPGLLPGVSVLR